MRKIVAIHQPNFFPWLGFFDKIRRADVFVFLDDVSYIDFIENYTAGAGEGEILARLGAVRAHPDREVGRRRGARTLRRHSCRLPACPIYI